MKPITVQLSPEEANNAVVLWDLAVRHPEGGIKAARAAIPLIDKINVAVSEAQKPDAP